MSLVALGCESLHVCIVCIWRCEHAMLCVKGSRAIYRLSLNHSFKTKANKLHVSGGLTCMCVCVYMCGWVRACMYVCALARVCVNVCL